MNMYLYIAVIDSFRKENFILDLEKDDVMK